ncbi:MAG TPA: hypothetical protein VGE50_13735 [Gammaproteobacteria bacterium]
MNPSARIHPYLLFATLTLGFGVVTTWLLHNNFVNDAAIVNWASLAAIFDAKTLRLENLGFAHPHGPMLILAPLHFIHGIGAAAPYIVSVMAVAFLMTLWNRHLRQGDYSAAQRALLVVLMAAHPALLWGATGGGREAISLLMFYLLYRSCLRMVYEKDMRSFIALGMVLAAFFYFDVISIFLFLALLPLLLVLVPSSMMREAPFSVYIMIGMPLLIALGSWIYFNWIFYGEPLAFINYYASGFAGARIEAETLPWLREFGGQFALPTLLGACYVLLGYPVLLFLMLRSYKEGRQLRISLVLMLHPALAIGFATWAYYLASPLQLSVLIAAGVMAELNRIRCHGRCMVPLVMLLGVGIFSSWLLVLHDDYSHLQPWTAALQHQQPAAHLGDKALGHWLAEHREPTLLDLHSAHQVVTARGDAVGLLLPFTPEYRLAMRSDRPAIPQIAVPNPDTPAGVRDAINVRFPQLYESGLSGYQRVYDEDGWRVYRRVH